MSMTRREISTRLWHLVYTSNSELFVLLAADQLPLVSIGDITQTIDGALGTVENRVAFSGPLVESSVSVRAGRTHSITHTFTHSLICVWRSSSSARVS